MADSGLLAQKNLAQRILNFSINTKSKKSAKSLTLSYLTSRLDLLESYWDKFTERHARLLILAKDFPDDEYFKSDPYNLVEDAYLEARSELSEDVHTLKSSLDGPSHFVRPQATSSVERIAPPPLKPPVFDGVDENWDSFRQRFLAFLDINSRLTDTSKLQYLLEAVQGPAAERLKGLAVVGTNYQIAWDRLIRRFDNRRIRLESHLETLIKLPAVRPRNRRDLTDLIDKSENLVQALTDLDYPISHTGHFVVHCVVRKLDPDTKEAWKLSLPDGSSFPTHKDLVKFLEHKAQSMDPAPGGAPPDATFASLTKSRTKIGPRRSVAANLARTDSSSRNSTPLCLFCSNKHPVYQCADFRSKSQTERFDWCKREGACLNCLNKGHKLLNCPSKRRCSVCSGKHHSLLHANRPVKAEPRPGVSPDQPRPSPPSQAEQEFPAVQACTTIAATVSSVNKAALLATAKIVVISQSGLSFVVRALVDAAAERSFISNHIALP